MKKSFYRLLPLWVFFCLITRVQTVCADIVSAGELFVDLKAGDHVTDLGAGTATWPNNGTLEDFEKVQGDPRETREVGGALAVPFEGEGVYMCRSSTPAGLVGEDPTRSVEVWAYNPQIAGEETMVAWSHRGGPGGTNMGFNYGNNASWGAVTHWGGGFQDKPWIEGGVTWAPPAAEWHHLVYTYDGTTTRVYVDGVLSSSEELGPGAINTWAGPRIILGAQIASYTDPENFETSHFYSGSLAKVRIHDGVLSAEDIVNNYREERAAFRAEDEPVVKLIEPATGILNFGSVDYEEGPSGYMQVIVESMTLSEVEITGLEIAGASPEDFGYHGTADLSNIPGGGRRVFDKLYADPVSDNSPRKAELVIETNAAFVYTPAMERKEGGTFTIPLYVNYETVYVDAEEGADVNPGTREEPFRTLQSALDASSKGGTIVLLPGEYRVMSENSWAEKFLTVKKAEEAAQGEVIIEQTHWAWMFDGDPVEGNVSADLSFEGIEFTGSASLDFFQPAGHKPEVRWHFKNCSWEKDYAWHGLCVGEDNAGKTTIVLEDCEMNCAPGVHSDIYIRSQCELTCRGCTFRTTNNTTVIDISHIEGDVVEGSQVTLEDCTLFGGGEGGGKPASLIVGPHEDLEVTVRRCMFTHKPGVLTSAAVDLRNLSGDVLCANCVMEGQDTGVRVSNSFNGQAAFYNCTVIGTYDSLHQDGFSILGRGEVNISNCIVLGWNTPINGAYEGEANFVEGDPEFVYPRPWERPESTLENDYHLTEGSPAAGAGLPLEQVSVDFEGNTRCDPPAIGAYKQCPAEGVGVYLGDINNDGAVDVADAIYGLNFLFAGGPRPPCVKTADANDDNKLDISDAIKLLSYMFAGGEVILPDGTETGAGEHPGCAKFDQEEVPDFELPGPMPGCEVPCGE